MPTSGFRPPKSSEPAFRSVVPVRAYEGVVDQIELAVFSGRLAPGDRLPSERDMMAQFAVSRATIREALRVLESRGLVRSRPGDPNGGPEIQSSSSRALTTAVRTFARLGQLNMAELVQFRMVAEGSAIRLAAVLHNENELAAMLHAHEQLVAAVDGSYETFSRADVAFHLAVAHTSGNELLAAFSEIAVELVVGLIRDRLHVSPGNAHVSPGNEEVRHDTVRRHGRYLDAIRDRDGARAERLARLDLYEYYGPLVNEPDRRRLEIMIEEETVRRPN